jgi:hypothetical protein
MKVVSDPAYDKQRLDSTHIVGYVKAMIWMECAIETLRLALEDLEYEVGKKKRPEFWRRLWEFYVESNLDRIIRVRVLLLTPSTQILL